MALYAERHRNRESVAVAVYVLAKVVPVQVVDGWAAASRRSSSRASPCAAVQIVEGIGHDDGA